MLFYKDKVSSLILSITSWDKEVQSSCWYTLTFHYPESSEDLNKISSNVNPWLPFQRTKFFPNESPVDGNQYLPILQSRPQSHTYQAGVTSSNSCWFELLLSDILDQYRYSAPIYRNPAPIKHCAALSLKQNLGTGNCLFRYVSKHWGCRTLQN